MPEREPDALENLLDLFVYAPIGLALDARELIPQLARRGKGQVDLAKVMGTLALRQGKGEVAKIVESVIDLLVSAGGSAAPDLVDEDNLGGPDPLAGADSWTVAQATAVIAHLEAADLRRLRAVEEAGKGRVTVLRRIDARLQVL